MNDWRKAPGYVSHKEAFGELTVTVKPEQIRAACEFARDELGFTLLSDIVATDYLGWGRPGVSGYIGTESGRDINFPMTQGLQVLPELKPKRFSVSYHLLAMRQPQGLGASSAKPPTPGRGTGSPSATPGRVRLQTWVDDGEALDSVVPVWPGADFYEREQFDMMGIPFDGHPNLKRLLMDDDWEGHPLRKDYPIGGEPVRFSEAE